MGIPRSAELIVYLTCAIIIYRKQDYYLNKVYSISLMGWAIYVICDMFLFPIGHIEPWSFGEIEVNGVMMSLPMITNILRDIQIIGGSIMSFGYLYASFIIRYGEVKSKEKKIILNFIIPLIILAVIVDLYDSILRDTSTYPDLVKTHYNFINIIFIIVEISLYFFAIYQHFRVYKDIGKNKPEKRKILYFILGSAFVAAGVLYFVIIGRLIPGQDYQLITGSIGHCIWIISPLFIYFGIKKK